MAENPGDSTVRLLVAFARNLRRGGLDVPVENVVQYVHAVEAVGLGRDHLYWAGRTVLVHRRDDFATYDDAFESFWSSHNLWPAPPQPPATSVEDLDDDAPPLAEDNADRQLALFSYSDIERLRQKDLADCSPEELREISRLLRENMPRATRRSRRMRRSPRAHGRYDTRATMRLTLRSGGEVVRLVRRRPASRPRRIVLLCDVSGSMEPYVRGLMHFLHVVVAGQSQVEAFAVGTRLTRLTRHLSSRDPDAAMNRATDEVLDWSGGTRLGEGIGTFNERFGMPGMARGAIVVILSDGLDRGDPEHLASEMARLQQASHLTIWVNPLKASPGYEPLARGMVAALPYVDRFVEGHSAASLEALVSVLASST